jgi:hypothetical protein
MARRYIFPRYLLAFFMALFLLSPMTEYTTLASQSPDFSFGSIQNFGLGRNPEVAVSSPNVYLAWTVDTNSGKSPFFTVSHDGGSTFTPAVNMSNNLGGLVSLLAADDNVYLFFGGLNGTNFTLFLRVSHDNGSTFSDSTEILNAPGISPFGFLANGDNLYLTWLKSGTTSYFMASQDGGVTFGKRIPGGPFVTATGSKVSLMSASSNSTGVSLSLRTSSDGGQTFGRLNQVFFSPFTLGTLESPSIASAKNHVYIMFNEMNTSGGIEASKLYLLTSNDGGANFGAPEKVAGFRANQQISIFETSLSAVADNVEIAYVEQLQGSKIEQVFFRSSTDAGSTFNPTVNLSRSSSNSAFNVQVGLSRGHVYAVWQQVANNSKYDTIFRKSDDNGASFGPIHNLSNSATQSTLPVVAAFGGNVYVSWDERSHGDYVMFTAHG